MNAVFVVTANRTSDGRAVYLTADRRWSEALSEAHPAPDEDAQEAALTWARTQQYDVCDPYLLSVTESEGRLSAITARERIRATGPSWIAQRFGYEV
jgi:hypothetical protein